MKVQDIEYYCPQCKEVAQLVEVTMRATVETTLTGLDKYGEPLRDEDTMEITAGENDHINCANCGETLKDTNGNDVMMHELKEFLRDNPPNPEYDPYATMTACDAIRDELEPLLRVKEGPQEMLSEALERVRDAQRLIGIEAQSRIDEIDEMIMTEDLEDATREAYQLEQNKLEELAAWERD